MPNQQKKHRGFAAMDHEKQREIASKGGKAAHEKGTAHEFTPEEAREAGRKGGEAVSQNREHMAAIGRKGGESSHGSRTTSSQGEDETRKGKNGRGVSEQAEAKR
ncbi:MAG TPA: KGG domain-containing protein [Acidiferrobacterales bacterium]|nr:KGG domain-containing protein [Acidiferrobacterales bacterium]